MRRCKQWQLDALGLYRSTGGQLLEAASTLWQHDHSPHAVALHHLRAQAQTDSPQQVLLSAAAATTVRDPLCNTTTTYAGAPQPFLGYRAKLQITSWGSSHRDQRGEPL